MPFKHLTRYTKPRDFADFGDINRTEYFVAYGRHRDSDTYTESNWRTMLESLGGESDTVLVLRDSHFAVGWVEAIYIHESDTARCQIADDALGRLEDYPLLSEDDHSSLECDRAYEYWRRASVKERLRWCQKYRCSPFAARHADIIPDDPTGELLSALAE